ncbi:winged helix-turn-helix transcriptional regulator [Novosphingobium pituita]|uniref:Helix-turn-helix domain-containing protein n=1 Tax=Novosphingobium pituita TaxID=3056842 RepID=A0ABQ6P7F9_9SPHN|nr:helix-turn-helix domain-containing protein [Novosphingobium sp. IK01]GMM61178.1 helix-turn-helix domain-containing protein [Novosphingobium sp. IK01]
MQKNKESLADLAQCGLPVALEVMGERWSFLILRAAFNGICHFEEFLTQLGIARNILSNRLSRLVDHGILARAPCSDDRRRVEYRLTAKGFDLLPAMLALRQWGEKWGAAVCRNQVLCDERDGRPIAPLLLRAHDGRLLGVTDLIWRTQEEIARSEAEAGAAPANQDTIDRKVLGETLVR